MVNLQTLQGNWNTIRGKLQNRWGQLTDDDLQRVEGSVDRLIGLIQRKTGETRDDIEHFLDEVAANGATAVNQAAEAAREYAHQAAETFQETSEKVTEAVRTGYVQAERMVQRRPGESLAVVFGVGLLGGLIVGLLLRWR